MIWDMEVGKSTDTQARSMRSCSALLLIAILALLGVSSTTAPPFPYPWFIEHLQLGTVDLPDGVSIKLVPDDPPFPFPVGESIVVRNASSTTLYVIGKMGAVGQAYARYEDIGVSLPPGSGPLHKIVNGQAYKWDAKEWNSATSSYQFGWLPEDNHGQGDAVWLFSGEENWIGTDAGTVVMLKALNNFGPGRPDGVRVPDPQSAVLPFVYGTRELNVPLTVSYSLNTLDYPLPDPSSGFLPPQVLACLGIPLLYLAGAGILWFVIRSMYFNRHRG